MNGNCPRCHTGLEIPRQDVYRCSRCGREFRAYPIRPPDTSQQHLLTTPAAPFLGVASPDAPAAASDAPAEARCATHANNRAVMTCERCGDFMCALCDTPLQGRRYCPRCYDLFLERGVVAVATGQTGNNPSNALVLSILSLVGFFCFPVNLALVVAAVVLSLGVLKQTRAQPELPGRGMAIAALIFSGLAVVAAAGYLIFRMARG